MRQQRRQRFRILACIDGSEESFVTVRFAARLAPTNDCDIIVLNVRPVDQGLWSGGLQVRLARQNMLEAGFDLPGARELKQALEILKHEGLDVSSWQRETTHEDAWGDPLGDNKIEYRSPEGRIVVLKLKTAPDSASGILDQYELGPYNRHDPRRAVALARRVPFVLRCRRRPAGGGAGALLGDDRAGEPRAARLLHLHRRDGPLDAGGAALGGARPYGQGTDHAVLRRPDLAGAQAAEENVKNARALLKAMGIKVAGIETAIGEPAELIIERGSNHRIIVVSDEGRSRLQRVFRGSIAYEVVKAARTSVLDVR